MKAYNNVDEYIESFPAEVSEKLKQMRDVILKTAPAAQEVISYGIPTFKMKRNLVHFAAYKEHIGFYPGAGAVKSFADEFSKYNTSKGTVQFPLKEKIPYRLVKKVVQFRLKEEENSIASKRKSSSKPTSEFLSQLSAPAARALKNAGITTPGKLAAFGEKEVLKLHGVGPASLPVFKTILKQNGLAFRK